jgi:preprotein translocase subunit YajC
MMETIQAGYSIVTADGDEAIGTVKSIDRQRKQFNVYLENSGEWTLPGAAIASVHAGKVVLDLSALSGALLEAVKKAHEAETE